MLISATHTHTAPTVGGVFQSDPDEDYQQVPGRADRRGHRAGQRQPGARRRSAGASARTPTQVFNRRWKMKPGIDRRRPVRRHDRPGEDEPRLPEPRPGRAGRADRSRGVGPVGADAGRPADRPAGQLLAALRRRRASRCRPTTSAPSPSASPSCSKADKADPPFVGIMSNGTSGDINNINFAGAAPGKQAAVRADPPGGRQRRPGRLRRLPEDRAPRPVSRWRWRRRRSSWASAGRARRTWPAPQEILGEGEGHGAEDAAGGLRPRDGAAGEVSRRRCRVKLQALRIGELGIAAIPCEVFVEIGLEIKKKSPLKPTFTIELANGYNGYLPTPEQHAAGRLRNLAGPVELPGGGGIDQDNRDHPAIARAKA